jgi:capsular polysaccharide biosynthesis protein
MILRDVNVNSQLIFWKGLRILNESKLNLVDPDFYRKPSAYISFLILNYFIRKRRKIEGKVLWVVDNWTINYYHWLVDALPRLLSTQMDLSQVTIVLPSIYKATAFQAKTLDLLGVKYVYFDVETERVHSSELYLPLYVSIAGTANPVYIRKVRELLLSRHKYSDSGNKRVYVTRRRAPRRKISNEDAVIRIVEPLGFVVAEFENMSFEEQVSLCRGASILIGLHGAGLTNMMFMETNATVLEFRRENEQNFCYPNLAEALRLRYHSLECKNEGNDIHNSDFYVNLQEFEHLVTSIL